MLVARPFQNSARPPSAATTTSPVATDLPIVRLIEQARDAYAELPPRTLDYMFGAVVLVFLIHFGVRLGQMVALLREIARR